MKKLLLFFVLAGINAHAQEFEGGIGGGFCINTQPTDNMVYKGDQSVMNYSANLRALYTIKENWQFGVELQMHELSSKSTKKYGGFYNGDLKIDSVGGDDKKLVYAKYLVNAMGVANKRFDIGTGSYAYIGAAFGLAVARNNSKRYESNESYKCADGGRGIAAGAQIGYAANISEKLGIYLEASWRYYHLDYRNADAPQVLNGPVLKYNIMAFPCTFGIRYVFHKITPNQYGTYNRDKRRFYENKKYNK